MIRAGQVNAKGIDKQGCLIHNTPTLSVGGQMCVLEEAAWYRSRSSKQDSRVAILSHSEALLTLGVGGNFLFRPAPTDIKARP